MKKLFLVVMTLCLAASFVYAQETTAPAATTPETLTLSGDIIDNMCAGTQTAEDLVDFVKTHTKQCALQPACVASGYNIFADGKLYQFDKDSNTKIEEFLKKEDSKLQVTVVATKVGEELILVSIENRK